MVSGFVLKLIRGSIGFTQAEMAERLGIDISTIQGWETGKRPLTALRAADLIRLKTRLVMLGGSHAAVGTLQDSIEADGILSLAIAAGEAPVSLDVNPLAAAVHRRSLVHMITWPFTGISPPVLRDLPSVPARGPVAKHPVLSNGDRGRFFDHLLTIVNSRQTSRSPVLRRQATYLLGFDERTESADWLSAEYRRVFVAGTPSADLPAGIAARSATVALARRGDADPLRYFIKHTLSRDDHAAANLTYWAYWLGEITESYTDDSFLIAGADEHGWSGGRVAEHLLQHLDNDVHSHLNIHSLGTLILARPDLLRRDRKLRATTGQRVAEALDMGFDGETRDELINLRYAVQLAGR